MKKATYIFISFLIISVSFHISDISAQNSNSWSFSLSYGQKIFIQNDYKFRYIFRTTGAIDDYPEDFEASYRGDVHIRPNYEVSAMVFKHFGTKFKLGAGIGQTTCNMLAKEKFRKYIYKTTMSDDTYSFVGDDVKFNLKYITIPVTGSFITQFKKFDWGMSLSFITGIKQEYIVHNNTNYGEVNSYVRAVTKDFDNKIDLFANISTDFIFKLTDEFSLTLSPNIGTIIYDGSLQCSGIGSQRVHSYVLPVFFHAFDNKDYPNRTYCGIRLSLEYMF